MLHFVSDFELRASNLLKSEQRNIQKQKKSFLYIKNRKNSGKIDPTDIEDYIAADGYSALCKALSAMTPAEIVETVFASGLRGRGGFPNSDK